MSKKMKLQLLKEFDIDTTFKKLIRTRDDGNQFVFGRELSKFWGYKEWRNFLEIIKKGIENYPNSNNKIRVGDNNKIGNYKGLEVNEEESINQLNFVNDRDDSNPDFVFIREKIETGIGFKYKLNCEISLNAVMFCVHFADANKPVVMNFAIAIGSYIKFLEKELKRLTNEANDPFKKFYKNKNFLEFKQTILLRVENADTNNLLKEIFSKIVSFLIVNNSDKYDYNKDFKILISGLFNCFYFSFYGVDKRTLCTMRGLSAVENCWDWFDNNERIILKSIRDIFVERYNIIQEREVILSFEEVQNLIKDVVIPFKKCYGDTINRWKFRKTKLPIDRDLATRLNSYDN